MEHSKIEKSEKGIAIDLSYAIVTSGSKYIAVAPHLNIVGFGNTESEAEKDFDEAVNFFISFHVKHKNLNAKLVNLGWKLQDHKPFAPEQFSVPMDLLRSGSITKTVSKEYKEYAECC